MRITLPRLAVLSVFALGACVSAPVASGPAPIRPLELTIVRPEYDKLLVQTNRYAYVAVFEILPERGVSIVYPETAHDAERTVGGMEWLPVALQPAHVTYRGFPPRRVVRAHYVYAIASDRPFQISDQDYDPYHLEQELGEAAYRGDNVAATMRALAREFVPVLPAERWSEDSYALEEAQETPIVRVYCADGNSIEIRETIVSRVRCSSRPPAVVATGGSPNGSGGGYAPPRSGPAPVASNPTPAPTPTPRPSPSLPWPRRDTVVQAGTPRRVPPTLRLPVDATPAADSSTNAGSSGDSHGGDHRGNGDDHGGVSNGNGGTRGNGDGRGNGDDHGRGSNGNGNANGQGNGQNNGNNGNAYGHEKDHGNGNAYGHDNGNGRGADTTSHGAQPTPRPELPHGLGLGIGAPRARPGTPGIGDANPHPATPASGNSGGSAASGGSSNGSATHGASGNGAQNGNGASNGSGASNANGSAKGDDGKKAAPGGRPTIIREKPDTTDPKAKQHP